MANMTDMLYQSMYNLYKSDINLHELYIVNVWFKL